MAQLGDDAYFYEATVFHKRFSPKTHQFTYPVCYGFFDVEKLGALSKKCSWFSLNKRGFFSLWEKDYLGDFKTKEAKNLNEKIYEIYESECIQKPYKTYLLTMPLLFGKGFNPVSFFYGFDDVGNLESVIAFVNNTYGDSHYYLLTHPIISEDRYRYKFQNEKVFHVSPFYKREGVYEFTFDCQAKNLRVSIEYKKENETLFIATLNGKLIPWNTRGMLKTLIKYPINILLTIPRIAYQAAKLKFLKGLPVITRKAPNHPNSVRKREPKFIEKICMKQILKRLSAFEEGQITITFPDFSTLQIGNPDKGLTCEVSIHDYAFFRRLVFSGDIGLGESYMLGEWDSNDLSEFLCFMAQNLEILLEVETGLFFKHIIHNIQHRSRQNTIKNSKKNISQHYDLSNEMYTYFLDDTMTYSAGKFLAPQNTLTQAQHAKFDQIIEMGQIGPDDHILEIGCGWGGFAIYAAQKTGCKATGITISNAQYEFATQRIKTLNLTDKVDIKICDYRHLTGKFDKIVSIEMLEAVGHDFLPTYFSIVNDCLKPGGRAVIQSIIIPDERYDAYCKSTDWIRKYIFPGGHLPSLGMINSCLSPHHLSIQCIEDITLDYAQTLAMWRDRFLARKDDVIALGFDETFIRTWAYYFSYCEAGFAQETIFDYQLLIQKEGT